MSKGSDHHYTIPTIRFISALNLRSLTQSRRLTKQPFDICLPRYYHKYLTTFSVPSKLRYSLLFLSCRTYQSSRILFAHTPTGRYSVDCGLSIPQRSLSTSVAAAPVHLSDRPDICPTTTDPLFFKSYNLLLFLPSAKHSEGILSLFCTPNSSARHLRSSGDQYCLPSSISVSCLSRRHGFSFPAASTPRRRRMTSPQQQAQQGISFLRIHSQMTYFAISSWVSLKEVQMGRRLCAAF